MPNGDDESTVRVGGTPVDEDAYAEAETYDEVQELGRQARGEAPADGSGGSVRVGDTTVSAETLESAPSYDALAETAADTRARRRVAQANEGVDADEVEVERSGGRVVDAQLTEQAAQERQRAALEEQMGEPDPIGPNVRRMAAISSQMDSPERRPPQDSETGGTGLIEGIVDDPGGAAGDAAAGVAALPVTTVATVASAADDPVGTARGAGEAVASGAETVAETTYEGIVGPIDTEGYGLSAEGTVGETAGRVEEGLPGEVDDDRVETLRVAGAEAPGDPAGLVTAPAEVTADSVGDDLDEGRVTMATDAAESAPAATAAIPTTAVGALAGASEDPVGTSEDAAAGVAAVPTTTAGTLAGVADDPRGTAEDVVDAGEGLYGRGVGVSEGALGGFGDDASSAASGIAAVPVTTAGELAGAADDPRGTAEGAVDAGEDLSDRALGLSPAEASVGVAAGAVAFPEPTTSAAGGAALVGASALGIAAVDEMGAFDGLTGRPEISAPEEPAERTPPEIGVPAGEPLEADPSELQAPERFDDIPGEIEVPERRARSTRPEIGVPDAFDTPSDPTAVRLDATLPESPVSTFDREQAWQPGVFEETDAPTIMPEETETGRRYGEGTEPFWTPGGTDSFETGTELPMPEETATVGAPGAFAGLESGPGTLGGPTPLEGTEPTLESPPATATAIQTDTAVREEPLATAEPMLPAYETPPVPDLVTLGPGLGYPTETGPPSGDPPRRPPLRLPDLPDRDGRDDDGSGIAWGEGEFYNPFASPAEIIGGGRIGLDDADTDTTTGLFGGPGSN